MTTDGHAEVLAANPSTTRQSKKSPGLGGSRIFASAVHGLQHASKSLISSKITSPKDEPEIPPFRVKSPESKPAAIAVEGPKTCTSRSIRHVHSRKNSIGKHTRLIENEKLRRSSEKKKKKRASDHRRKRSEASTDGEQQILQVKSRRKKKGAKRILTGGDASHRPCIFGPAVALSKLDNGSSSDEGPSSPEISVEKVEMELSSELESQGQAINNEVFQQPWNDPCEIIVISSDENIEPSLNKILAYKTEKQSKPCQSPGKEVQESGTEIYISTSESVVREVVVQNLDSNEQNDATLPEMMQFEDKVLETHPNKDVPFKKSSWIPLKADDDGNRTDKKYNPKAYQDYVKKKRCGLGTAQERPSSCDGRNKNDTVNVNEERSKEFPAEYMYNFVTSEKLAAHHSAVQRRSEDLPPDTSTKMTKDWLPDTSINTTKDWPSETSAITATEGLPSETSTKTTEDWPSETSVKTTEDWPSETSAIITTEDWLSDTSAVNTTEDWPSEASAIITTEDWLSETSAVKTTEDWPSETSVKTTEDWPSETSVKKYGKINRESTASERKAYLPRRKNEFHTKRGTINTAKGRGQAIKLQTKLSSDVKTAYEHMENVSSQFENSVVLCDDKVPSQVKGSGRWAPIQSAHFQSSSRSVDKAIPNQRDRIRLAKPAVAKKFPKMYPRSTSPESKSESSQPVSVVCSMDRCEVSSATKLLQGGSQHKDKQCNEENAEVLKDSLQTWDTEDDRESSFQPSHVGPSTESKITQDDSMSEPLSQDSIDIKAQWSSDKFVCKTSITKTMNFSSSFEPNNPTACMADQNLEGFLNDLAPNIRAIRSSYKPPAPPSGSPYMPQSIDSDKLTLAESNHSYENGCCKDSQTGSLNVTMKSTDGTKLEDEVFHLQKPVLCADIKRLTWNGKRNKLESDSEQVAKNGSNAGQGSSPLWAVEDEWDCGSETQKDAQNKLCAIEAAPHQNGRSSSPNLKCGTTHEGNCASWPLSDGANAMQEEYWAGGRERSGKNVTEILNCDNSWQEMSSAACSEPFVSDVKKPLAIIPANPKPPPIDASLSGKSQNRNADHRHPTRWFGRSRSEYETTQKWQRGEESHWYMRNSYPQIKNSRSRDIHSKDELHLRHQMSFHRDRHRNEKKRSPQKFHTKSVSAQQRASSISCDEAGEMQTSHEETYRPHPHDVHSQQLAAGEQATQYCSQRPIYRAWSAEAERPVSPTSVQAAAIAFGECNSFITHALGIRVGGFMKISIDI